VGDDEQENDMAKDTQVDALGRELQPQTTSGPQTVTQFAVEQGALEKDDSVAAAISKEQAAAKAGTERAKSVSAALAPATPEEDGGE
jgi:hypothetical protein